MLMSVKKETLLTIGLVISEPSKMSIFDFNNPEFNIKFYFYWW